MVKLEIEKCDVTFICEAIEQRALYLTTNIMGATMSSIKDQINELNDLVSSDEKEDSTPKKPHWTQTAKGKKILARRRKKK
jgi:hypothetical protein